MRNSSQTSFILENIKIREDSGIPKYLQLVLSIKELILKGKVGIGAQLPSVNEASFEYYLARDTIVKAYNRLKEQGIIKAVPGKGYFIASTNIKNRYRIFLLFNKLSAHKKIIYDAFVSRLGESASIDFYVYHNDCKVFQYLLDEHLQDEYHYFVIIPHFEDYEEEVKHLINQIPSEKLILLDNKIEGVREGYSSVYQNFQNDIYKALTEANDLLQKYESLKLVFPRNSYHSEDIVRGFRQFSLHQDYEHKILGEVIEEEISKGTAFVVIKDEDLVQLIKFIRKTNMVVGRDIGIISYNETPLKEVLLDGITVMSTDFAQIGISAANMILEQNQGHLENSFTLIRRKSL